MAEKTSNVMIHVGALMPSDSFTSELASLPKDQQDIVIRKQVEGKVALSHEASTRVFKSNLAQHDISNFVSNVNAMSDHRKVYSAKVEGETGSGSYEMNVKGGDTKFIIPILCALGIIVVIIMVLVRH